MDEHLQPGETSDNKGVPYSRDPATLEARQHFLGQVNQIKGNFAMVESNLDKMRAIHTERVAASSLADVKRLLEKLQELLDSTNENIRQAQSGLRKIEAENREFKGGSGEQRMRQSQFEALASSLIDLTGKVQEQESVFAMQYRKKLKGEIEIADPTGLE
eukprot:EC789425.1.p1 GENE.EC789425.1~~EC789425.1.p1  ORF type:complete len:168 (+),score=44.10 EC789425.1:26-505(+)